MVTEKRKKTAKNILYMNLEKNITDIIRDLKPVRRVHSEICHNFLTYL